MSAFERAKERWEQAARAEADVEAEYRSEHARAFLTAEVKTEKQREAAANDTTAALHAKRDYARVAAQAARWEVEYLLRHGETAA